MLLAMIYAIQVLGNMMLVYQPSAIPFVIIDVRGKMPRKMPDAMAIIQFSMLFTNMLIAVFKDMRFPIDDAQLTDGSVVTGIAL